MTRYPQGTNAFAASVVMATGRKLVKSVSAYNKNASTVYLQIFDAAALPSNNAIPLQEVAIPTKSIGFIDFPHPGSPVSNGLVAAFSSTDDKLTVLETSDGLFHGLLS